MPNLETPSELADHLADLLGIYEDERCKGIGWYDQYPVGFIGPIQERPEEYDTDGHIKDCDCRVIWILKISKRFREAVINKLISDLSAFKRPSTKSVTLDAKDIGRFTGRLSSNKSNLKSVDTPVTGRLVDKGPELQDPRGLDIEKPKNVEHNKTLDVDYAKLEKRVLDSLSPRDMAIAKNYFNIYGPIDRDLVDISSQYVNKPKKGTKFVHKAGLGFDFGDKVEHIRTGEIGTVISEADPHYHIGYDEVMIKDSIEETWCWSTDEIRKIE